MKGCYVVYFFFVLHVSQNSSMYMSFGARTHLLNEIMISLRDEHGGKRMHVILMELSFSAHLTCLLFILYIGQIFKELNEHFENLPFHVGFTMF